MSIFLWAAAVMCWAVAAALIVSVVWPDLHSPARARGTEETVR